jgi:chorismate-pyruvate lyase
MDRMIWRGLIARISLLLVSVPAVAADSTPAHQPAWRDDFVTRLEALALLQSLNADLLSHDSATLTLDRWCAVHRMASTPKIVAERVHNADKSPTAEQRQALGVSDTEPVRYRRVRLHCGDYVLSEADNWYVPARLTPEMNHALDTTDVPFGRVVQPLHFQRKTLSATLLWWPIPEGWEVEARVSTENSKSLQIPSEVLLHRAVLELPDGTPFSEVVETYQSAVLAFPQPYHP